MGHASPPLGKRSWTAEDEAYLMDKWGCVSVPAIAKALKRTVNAVKIRAQRLGLGAVLESGDYVTFNQFIRVFQNSGTTAGYQMQSWVANRGFPVHTKRVVNNTFRVVYLDEFWKWSKLRPPRRAFRALKTTRETPRAGQFRIGTYTCCSRWQQAMRHIRTIFLVIQFS